MARPLPADALQFATLPFVAFFLPVLGLAWATRPWPTARKVFLLVASYWFYAGWDVRLLTLIVSMSLVTWLAGEFVSTATRPAVRRFWMWAAIAVNVGTLGWFKYYSFFRDNVEALAQLFGVTSGLPILEILLPVGISYTTFQCMAYVIDLHRGYGVRAKSLLDFLLFIAFFPQVLIGPICRSRDLLPQLEAPAPAGMPDLSRAVSLISSGLFKKVVLSSYLATHLVEDAFNAPEAYSSVELLTAAYAYTIQIYCDFSGYTDMALGIGLLMGVYLPDNFNQPYRAQSIAEFWRRWHMTFSNWLRDYVFLPLGGSWGSQPRTWFNLMMVMWVTGIWHGAAWKYMVWGSIHGVALVAYKVVQDRRKARGIDPKSLSFPAWYRALAWLYTFHLVVLARIFFRSTDMEVAWTYWGRLLGMTVWGHGTEWLVYVVIAIGLGLNFWGQHVRRWFIDLHERAPVLARPLIWAAVATLVLVLQPADVAPFIYFKF
ncbi:MAG: MBOAT family protein [Alphaproteobacteria bacterium]|nr:MBOAT family protein [Alphaproteobacteria bacterium]